MLATKMSARRQARIKELLTMYLEQRPGESAAILTELTKTVPKEE